MTSALDGGEWSASRPGRFTPRERALVTYWIGGWVGPKVGLNAVVKRKITSPRRDLNPPIIQPVIINKRNRHILVSIMTKLRVGRPGFNSRQGQGFFLFTFAPRLVLGPT
jgi:hypothetical protein